MSNVNLLRPLNCKLLFIAIESCFCLDYFLKCTKQCALYTLSAVHTVCNAMFTFATLGRQISIILALLVFVSPKLCLGSLSAHFSYSLATVCLLLRDDSYHRCQLQTWRLRIETIWVCSKNWLCLQLLLCWVGPSSIRFHCLIAGSGRLVRHCLLGTLYDSVSLLATAFINTDCFTIYPCPGMCTLLLPLHLLLLLAVDEDVPEHLNGNAPQCVCALSIPKDSHGALQMHFVASLICFFHFPLLAISFLSCHKLYASSASSNTLRIA